LNVAAGASLTASGGVNASVGMTSSTTIINIEGTLVSTGNFTYEGGSASGAVEVNISGSGKLDAKGLVILGGYSATYQSYEVNMSGSANITMQASKTVYIGGNAAGNVSGQTVVNMSGTASITGVGSNSKCFVGQTSGDGTIKTPGRVNLNSSGAFVSAHQMMIKEAGTIGITIDAGGAGHVATYRPAPTTQAYVWFMEGSIIDIDDQIGSVSGDAYDVAITPDWTDLKWEDADDGTYNFGVHLAPEDSAAWWRLREKPGNAGILQIVMIPEPTTMALLGIGGLLLAIRRRS